MKDEAIRQQIHRAVDAHGAPLRENPFLAQRIIAQSRPDRKEAPRMKKLSTGAIIAIVLMLLSVTALAIGLTAEEIWQQSYEKMNTSSDEIRNYGEPAADEISLDEALAIARKAIQDAYGTSDAELDSMGLYPTFFPSEVDGGKRYPSEWKIWYSSARDVNFDAEDYEYDLVGDYRVYINGETGEVTYCGWYTDDFWARAQIVWDQGNYDDVYFEYRQSTFYKQPIEQQRYWENKLAEKGYEIRTDDTQGKELLRSIYLDVLYYEPEQFLNPAQDAQAAAAWDAVEQVYGYDAALMQKYSCVPIRLDIVSETDDIVIVFNHLAAPDLSWHGKLERGGQRVGAFLIRFAPGTTEIVSTAHMPYSYWSAIITPVTEGKLFAQSDWDPEDFRFFDLVYTETEKAMARMDAANTPGLEKTIVIDTMMIALGANPRNHTNTVEGYDVAQWFSDEGPHVSAYAPTLNQDEVVRQYGESSYFWPLDVQYDLRRQYSAWYSTPREGELTEDEAAAIALDAIRDAFGADALAALGDY